MKLLSAHTALRRQAGIRLIGVVFLLAAGIFAVGLNSFYTNQLKDVAQKRASLHAYYSALLPVTDETWQRQAQQTRARIEFLRILETTRDDRWATLTTFLNAQGEFNDFAALLIIAPGGETVFRYGPDALTLDGATVRSANGWHVVPARKELFRVLTTPLWMGPNGQGEIIFLRSIGPSTLAALAAPDVNLLVQVNGQVFSSSVATAVAEAQGAVLVQGLVEDRPTPVIQLVLDWDRALRPAMTADSATTPQLIVQSLYRQSYPLGEFLLRPVAAVVLALVLILAGLGTWLRRTVRRIESLGAATRAYQVTGDAHSASQELKREGDLPDEIYEVGTALSELMHSVAQRDQEQRAYLDTLALLDDAILELDCQGVIQRASQGWQKLTLRDENAVGENFADYLIATDRDNFFALCQTMVDGDAAQNPLRVRLRVDPGAPQRWLECRFVARHDAGGKILGTRGVVRDVTQAHQNEQQISHMALHDALTDLPNRVLLEDRIKVALRLARRNQRHVAVCFIDLDHFKTVNDTLGHSAGDALLQAFTQLIRSAMREGDTLARWGGDEFVLLLPDMSSISDVRDVVHKVMAVSRESVVVREIDLTVAFSMGVALYPDDALDGEMLLAQADRALFYAKSQGRNQASVFADIGLKSDGPAELYLQQKLAEAVKAHRIEAYFQPLISAHNGRCVGVEVLARWHDPAHGWISPATFIPMAENQGLIGELGNLILLQSLDALLLWRGQGITITASINISRRQLFAPNFATHIQAELKVRGLSPGDIVLEVTESVATQDAANTVHQLLTLKQAGFHIAIDDFGTGYSSLSQLHEIPATELKIDISFVRRIQAADGRSLVQAIIQLASALRLKTVAEGVEDLACANTLTEMGVDILQGYHFAKPMPLQAFTEWLQTR